ncbi:MAG: carbamoyltransferase HypF [Caldimicrobium sp.]
MKRGFKLVIKGIVQGVGFRPFIYNLAKKYHLSGWVKNTSKGVEIVIEGEVEQCEKFIKEIPEKAPSQAKISEINVEEIPAAGLEVFFILKGGKSQTIEFDLLPDLAICKDCLKELLDPKDRRFEYPFLACTSCGPRFSVIECLPYERENTTLKIFPLCKSCKEEYENPEDRRFHAEAIACPICGPHLFFYDNKGNLIAEKKEALLLAINSVKEGKILALKGLTGFHLITRADLPPVIEELRRRKQRKKKPFAVMIKSVEEAEKYVFLTDQDKELLLSPFAPILILKSKELLPSVLNDGLDSLGIFIPYTPLHYLLLKELPFPVICTSGNFSDEPILYDNKKALEKLSKIADYFLIHNRPIRRPLDDSVMKKAGSFYIMIRRGRGYTPSPVTLPFQIKAPILALGAHEKNTFALAFQNKILVSQHIGDLDNLQTLNHFEQTIKDYLTLYGISPKILVSDLHPLYASTIWAKNFSEKENLPLYFLQHHVAHLYSVLAEENLLEGKFLGISWDGTGYGLDGTIWGGEFFLLENINYKRIYTFRPFRLLGGEKAIKEPKRVALALLFEIFGEEALTLDLPFLKTFSKVELTLLLKAWQEGINSPQCTSVGRLFDALSALLNLCYVNTYSGEAAMKVESLYRENIKEYFPFNIIEDFYLDWEPMIKEIINSKDKDVSLLATKFINTLAQIVHTIAEKVKVDKVCLSGGVMMNAPLIQRIEDLLRSKSIKIFKNKNFPPNDGNISLGQAYFTALLLEKS